MSTIINIFGIGILKAMPVFSTVFSGQNSSAYFFENQSNRIKIELDVATINPYLIFLLFMRAVLYHNTAIAPVFNNVLYTLL